MNLKLKEILTQGLPNKMKRMLANGDSKIKRLTWNLPFLFIHWLKLLILKLQRITKIRTFDLPLEIVKVTSKPGTQNSSAETFDLHPEIMFTPTTDLKKNLRVKRSNLRIRRVKRTTVNIVVNPITLFRIVFANNAKMKEENPILILDRN